MPKEDDTTNSIETTIYTMQTMGTCRSPIHLHSFRGTRPLHILRRTVCIACQQTISGGFSLLPMSTPTAVQCVSCLAYAHRSCAAKSSPWNATNKCQVDVSSTPSIPDALTADDDIDTKVRHAVEQGEEVVSSIATTKDVAITASIPDGTPSTISTPTQSDPFPNKLQQTTGVKKKKSEKPKHSVSSYPALRAQQQGNDEVTSTETERTDTQIPIDHPMSITEPIDNSWEVTVAAIAGGVAGLMIAGPVGAAGGAIAAAAARQQREQTRRLMLHNGVTVSVRPNIPTDPIWFNYVAQAVRTAPQRRRQSRNDDITSVAESEINTNDKILLLVHRTLNDANGQSGHMYRYLMAIYEDRAKQKSTQPRRRRDDVHAVVRHVTARVVQERPELGGPWTEVTVAAVESLVFGQLYDSVMEEIVEETCERDVELWRKISLMEGELGRTSREVLESTVSQKAISSLEMLPKSHSATEKLHFCVQFLDRVSEFVSETIGKDCSADSLLKAVCQHVVYLENNISSYAEIAFLEEFSRDDALLRGREGYALVTLQACLGFLEVSSDLLADVLDLDRGDLER